jgi:eukaryotic-like serine/threonine-protein kinase
MPIISESIGRVLGKRYRLVSALGTGSSAHVFLAEDVSLQRHVAVKLLQPGLASDEAFLKRFRAEARSVASLNHPHVLRVFDWGEDSDGPYLVLEYLGGGSLRDLLDRGVRLSHSQAAHMGTEVAQGLAYAHARGLVHRDIKPANLLFDEEGRVRVADFGVARALAESAWTEPIGAMVGTARYISPEAAEGKLVDGRADVYSLALVLYEAVSGTVPFVSDTTMGTLMARVGSTLPPHPALGPLDDVLARAAAPQASARLDAAGLAARLGALASALPTPEPLPLVAPHSDLPAPISGFRAPGVDELTNAVGIVDGPAAPVGTRAGPGEIFDAEPPGSEPTMSGTTVGSPIVAAPRRARRKLPWLIAAVVIVLALVAGGLVAAHDKVFAASHSTPALSGLSLTSAQAAAKKDNFTLRLVKGVTSITVRKGSIVSQVPKAGTVRKEGSTLTVVPSLGPPEVSVPSLTGLTCAQAIDVALKNAHLHGACDTAQYDANVANSLLISWKYRGTVSPKRAPYGATIDLVPSRGHPPVDVPTTITQSDTYGEAQAALVAVGLTAKEDYAASTSVAAGDVIVTDPLDGQPAPFGSAVVVTVSTGPPTAVVPNVLGDSVSQAATAIQGQGLLVQGVDGNPNGTVVGTDPPAGTTVDTGSNVTIFAQ